jgi:pimeloyl-ACP methyl ester carboxylesterase
MTHLRTIRQPKLRWIVTAALLASLAGLVLSQVGAADAAGSATAGAATAGATTSPGGSKPTVVLVHGAWADSGSWDQVVARLQRQGYPVIAFPTPLRSLPDDSAYLAAFLSSVPGPIVLVGHSYGGAVVTNAATGNEHVKALVYVDAFLPDEGETLGELLGTPPGSCVLGDPLQIFDLRPILGAPPDVVDAYVIPEGAGTVNPYDEDGLGVVCRFLRTGGQPSARWRGRGGAPAAQRGRRTLGPSRADPGGSGEGAVA